MSGRHVIPDFRRFVLAGRAIFTAVNPETGTQLTFRVARKSKDSDVFLVSWLAYGDNVARARDYLLIGTVRETDGQAPTFYAHPTWGEREFARASFDWILRHADDPAPAVVYHEGRCGRCSRLLTDPVSILHAFGPECATEMHLVRPSLADVEGETVTTAREIHRFVAGPAKVVPFRTQRQAADYVSAETDAGLLSVSERIEMALAERVAS